MTLACTFSAFWCAVAFKQTASFDLASVKLLSFKKRIAKNKLDLEEFCISFFLENQKFALEWSFWLSQRWLSCQIGRLAPLYTVLCACKNFDSGAETVYTFGIFGKIYAMMQICLFLVRASTKNKTFQKLSTLFLVRNFSKIQKHSKQIYSRITKFHSLSSSNPHIHSLLKLFKNILL